MKRVENPGSSANLLGLVLVCRVLAECIAVLKVRPSQSVSQSLPHS